MEKLLKYSALLVSVAFAVATTACVKKSTTKSINVVGTVWNVKVCKVTPLDDTLTGISTDSTYTLADTATINQKLIRVKPENLTLDWTIPSADGKIWLVAYENEPILSETVAVTEANFIPSYEGNIQVGFKFADAKKWETITQENIGKKLAVFVNGSLMNAPQVNSEVTSGNCSVSIPFELVHNFLPNLELENFK